MSNYPLLNLFLTMLWFFLWVLWLMLLFRVIVDIFRDDDLGGWAKAGWLIGVCVLPFLGIFVYLIARGRGMGERELRHARNQEQAFRAYIKEAATESETTAGTTTGATEHAPEIPSARTGGHAGTTRSRVDELEKLAGLRDHGALTEEEFQRAKQKLLSV